MNKLLTLLFVSFAFILSAQDFTISNFDINLEIDENGSFHVQEILDVNFTKKKRGIYREIETIYSLNGGKVDLEINNINIEGHDFKVEKQNGSVNIRIGNPKKYVTGNQTYKISYTLKNGIITFPDHQEFLYDLTGNDWKAKIENVDFTIKLPKSITLPASDFKITGGKKGQNLDLAEIRQTNSKTLSGNSLGILNEYNGLTAAIRLPKNYLDVAQNNVKYYQQPIEKVYYPWYISIPLAIFAFFVSFWRKMRKNTFLDDGGNTKQAYPPKGLTSAHLGAFIDQTANTRDIVSLLPYWASEGFIEMKQIGEEIYLYKIKDLDINFPEYEHIIFERLFKDEDFSKISDLKTKFYTTLSTAKSMLTAEVKLQDYYNQEYINLFKSWKLVLFPLAMIVLGLISLISFKLIIMGIGFFLVAIGGLILPLFSLPLTQKGARLKSEIDSFKRFLKNPDDEVLEKVINEDPSYFDNMFPFAVALGLEEKFLKKLEPYMLTAPLWYHSDQHNNSFSNFSNGFKPEVIQSAFSSTPHSSSSSSGGGFSSGGGVGGGGGGSW